MLSLENNLNRCHVQYVRMKITRQNMFVIKLTRSSTNYCDFSYRSLFNGLRMNGWKMVWLVQSTKLYVGNIKTKITLSFFLWFLCRIMFHLFLLLILFTSLCLFACASPLNLPIRYLIHARTYFTTHRPKCFVLFSWHYTQRK